jgi:hypothetical protein
MLAAWESGLGQGHVQRGLTLLALACPDIPEEDLPGIGIGRRDWHLLALRAAAFGPRMTGLAACPECGAQMELEIDVADLAGLGAAQPGAEALTVLQEPYEVRLRLPDSRDLLACAECPEDAATVLMHRCIAVASRNGTPIEIRSLPQHVLDRGARRLAEADPHADLRLALSCACCSSDWSAPFDIVSYLWAEVDAWAQRLLQEVHLLAQAYGWGERDILALSPARRRRYLQMVAA